jgi:Ankyrin repeats (3 copies)
MAERGAG